MTSDQPAATNSTGHGRLRLFRIHTGDHVSGIFRKQGAKVRPKRPLIRYHGGKYRIADFIISHFPKHEIYVEPFGGAASVLLAKDRSKAEVYNDLDSDIVNLFRVMRYRGPTLLKKLSLTPYAREEFIAAYKQTEDQLERARRTVIRAYMGFNAAASTRASRVGFRSDTRRKYTTSSLDWTTYPKAATAIIERLRGVVIENQHAIKVIEKQDFSETLFYCDPPYTLNERYLKQRTKIYRHEMSDGDHIDLLQVLKNCRGMVILSGYDNEIYRNFLTDWRLEKTETVASSGKGVKKTTECIWINPAAASRLDAERNTLFRSAS